VSVSVLCSGLQLSFGATLLLDSQFHNNSADEEVIRHKFDRTAAGRLAERFCLFVYLLRRVGLCL
jgi:hypothetical protein